MELRSRRDKYPMIMYVPSFLAVSIVAEVSKIVLNIIGKFGIDELVMFKT